MLPLLSILAIASSIAPTAAFPSLANRVSQKAQNARGKRATPAFDAASQHISVDGANAFVPPGHGDLRGPCPGLNALANHNYLPHNGVATIQQYVAATNQVFGMGIDLATFLSTYGAVMDGDGTSWSMGGPPGGATVPGVLSPPLGISNSHNKYEGDVSPTRGDLYEYGDDYSLRLDQFKALYALQSGSASPNYDIPTLTGFRATRFQQSIDNNPYFFNGPVTGIAVQPAAYTFIYRFMANKSAEYPEGILNTDVLKSFFAISGDSPDDFTYNPGWEEIPQNWYTRNSGDEYTIPFLALDTNVMAVQHPEFLSVGGNTGSTDSFTGVDIQNLTGGVYSASSLLEGNNAACLGYQAAIQLAPDFLKGLVSDVTGAVQQISNTLTGPLSQLGCPQLESIDESQLQQFPGYTKLNADGAY